MFAGLFVVAGALSSQVNENQDSTSSWIELECDVPGLDVWLNNAFVGQTPISPMAAAPGTHTLRVSHPDPTAWLARDWERTFTLESGDRRRFVAAFPRTYWIGSDPSDAAVTLGSRSLGVTPLVLSISPDSLRFVVLKKMGYDTYRLGPDWNQASLINVRLIKTSVDLGVAKDSPRLNKRWILVGTAAALICGGIGYYFKVKADRAYDRYLSSSHPDDMNHHFSRAEHYDRLTGIFYGVGEASLGITLFFAIRGAWFE